MNRAPFLPGNQVRAMAALTPAFLSRLVVVWRRLWKLIFVSPLLAFGFSSFSSF